MLNLHSMIILLYSINRNQLPLKMCLTLTPLSLSLSLSPSLSLQRVLIRKKTKVHAI